MRGASVLREKDAMRSTVGLEGEGALPQKIARFSGDSCIGLEEPMRQLSFLVK
jgi:hypothetical protein